MDLHRTMALLLSPVTAALIASLGTYMMEFDPVSLFIALVLIVLCPVTNIVRKSLSGEMDILVPDRFARGPFFIQAIACYSIASVILLAYGSFLMATLSLSYLMVTLVVTVINHWFTKISVHMAGLVGPSVFLLYFGNSLLGSLLLILAPLLGWSRWRSKSHTPSQIILGMAVSIMVTLLTCSLASALEQS